MRATRIIAAAPTGTLMKKINRHVTRVRTPPSTGPAEEAIAPPIAQIAMARALPTGSGYAWPMSAIDAGIIVAAAEPCRKRATTRAPMVGARPQAAEATTKTPRPAAKARRAPMRSVSGPCGEKERGEHQRVAV